MQITVQIAGDFAPFELAGLLSFVRGLDRDKRHWTVTIQDHEGSTLAEAERLLRDAMPDMPGRRTSFTVHRKQ